MTIFEILVAIAVGLIGAVPLTKLAKKVNVDIGGAGFALLVLIPVLQIPFIYYIAFKNKESKPEKVFETSEIDKKKNQEAWKG